MRKTILLFMLNCIVLLSFAQENSLLKKIFNRASYDTNYVTSYYKHHLHVTMVGIKQAQELIIQNNETAKRNIFNPNNGLRFGVGLDYNFLSLEYSRETDALRDNIGRSDRSESAAFRFGITGRRILASALIQNIKGMYLENPADNNPNWNSNQDGFPFRKDINSLSFIGSLNYFFNHERYSTMASLWQIDRQKKSAGSLNMGITFSYYNINSDSAIGPKSSDPFSTYQPVKSNVNYLYGLNIGYAYNFIWHKNFFANAFFIPGVNLQFGYEKRTLDKVETYSAKPGIHGDLRLMAGYNGLRYYGGIHYANYFLFSKLKTNTSIDLFNEYFRFFIGRRFDMSRKK